MIIEQHGGIIDFETKINHGTTFFMSFSNNLTPKN
jgi:signal transduction histidine kinase